MKSSVNSDKLFIETVSHYESSVATTHGDFHMSGIILVDLIGKTNSNFKVRTLLDSGAGTNFIEAELLPHIKHECISTQGLEVSGINTKTVMSVDLVRVFINNTDCPVKTLLCYARKGKLEYKVNNSAVNKLFGKCDLPNFTNPLEARADNGNGLGLILGPGAIRDISISPPQFHNDCMVDNTYFGPAISGRLPQSINTFMASHRFLTGETDTELYQFLDEQNLENKIELLENLEFLSNKESLGVKQNEMHLDDQICLDKFKNNVVYDALNKRYIVALPFNNNKTHLSSNEYVALKRAQILQRAFLADKEYGNLYAAQIQKLEAADFIEEVTEKHKTGEVLHYLPHRGIRKTDSKTTTLRIVMDASCKSKASAFSLNDCLFTGPNLIVSMATLLLKFRKEKYGCCADIEKAFLNLLIREADRDAMRFFFPTDPFDPSCRMKIYRYKVVMFGASCSPFLLAAVISSHLENQVKDKILQNSLKNIFVDNLVISMKTEDELIDLYIKAREVFFDMGLNLRQWASNSKKLTALVEKDGVHDESEKTKVLGYLWDPKTDKMSYKTKLVLYEKYTKRIVLRIGNQIYDTFGLILPIEMRFRIFLTKLWKIKLDWDDSFKKYTELVTEWDSIVEALQVALTATFPRTIRSHPNVELHLFSDASLKAYGMVAYFVIPTCCEYPLGMSQICFSKGKVVGNSTPKTIPKLELMGLVMSAHAAANLLDAYSDINFTRKVLWCDNMTALAQCASLKNDSSFVHNRVEDIREKCVGFELRYVDTKQNPADVITREETFKDGKKFLNCKEWWEGPSWITDQQKWCTDKDKIFNLHPDPTKNKRPTEWSVNVSLGSVNVNTFVGQVTATTASPEESILRKMWNFSHYKDAIHFFVSLNSIKNYLLHGTKVTKGPITASDFKAGEILAIKTMQKEVFHREIELLKDKQRVIGDKGQYAQLKLYLDCNGIIRINGRLADESLQDVNKPILMAYNHPLTILYIWYKHKCLNCSSVSYTLNQIRREIHSPKLRKQIRNLINKCITCRRILSRPYKHPEHPPLQEFRSKTIRPFSMVGVDYFGPYSVRTSEENVKKGEDKVWVVLYSCLVSRAVYLILVNNRRTETFMRTIRELSARYTEPILFVSDNEGAFKASNKILIQIAKSQEVQNYLKEKNITWKFLASRASWMGGVYERLIALIKIELTKMQKKTKFAEEEWRSHLHEVEAIVNDRPLTYVSDVGSEPEVITPNSIIHGCISETTIATDLNIDEAIIKMKEYQNNPIEMYKRKLELKKNFWKRLKEEYIIALRSSKYKSGNSKGKYATATPELNSVVAIYDPDTKLGGRLGVITKLIPSSDGQIRNAEVKTTLPSKVPIEKNYKIVHKVKAINHLIPLELKVELDEDLPQHLEDSDENAQGDAHQESAPQDDARQDAPQDEPPQDGVAEQTEEIDDVPTTSQSPNPADTSSISTEEEQEERLPPCAHPQCIRPKPRPERGLLWIKCMRRGCCKWHHYDCVGLDYNKSYKEESYACKKCWGPATEPNDFLGFGTMSRLNRPMRKAAIEATENRLQMVQKRLLQANKAKKKKARKK